MAQRKAAESELVSAAKALDRALDELATTAENIQRAPLTSQRHLERVREVLGAIPAAEAALSERFAALDRAIASARAARAAQAAGVVARVVHIEARVAELQRLLDRFAALGVRLGALSGGGDPAARAAELSALGGDAQLLLAESRRSDFPDVIRLAEMLGQQIAAARGR